MGEDVDDSRDLHVYGQRELSPSEETNASKEATAVTIPCCGHWQVKDLLWKVPGSYLVGANFYN